MTAARSIADRVPIECAIRPVVAGAHTPSLVSCAGGATQLACCTPLLSSELLDFVLLVGGCLLCPSTWLLWFAQCICVTRGRLVWMAY